MLDFSHVLNGWGGVSLSVSINMDIAVSNTTQVSINGHTVLHVSFGALPPDYLKSDTREPRGYTYLAAVAALS